MKLNKVQKEMIKNVENGAFRDARFFMEFTKIDGKVDICLHAPLSFGSVFDMEEEFGKNFSHVFGAFEEDIPLALDLDNKMSERLRKHLVNSLINHKNFGQSCGMYRKYKEQKGLVEKDT